MHGLREEVSALKEMYADQQIEKLSLLLQNRNLERKLEQLLNELKS